MENRLDQEALADTGGVIRHYFTHGREAAPSSGTLNSGLYCHSRSPEPISLIIEPDETITRQESHLGDFHSLPIPGHTPDSSAHGRVYPAASGCGRTEIMVAGRRRGVDIWCLLHNTPPQPVAAAVWRNGMALRHISRYPLSNSYITPASFTAGW